MKAFYLFLSLWISFMVGVLFGSAVRPPPADPYFAKPLPSSSSEAPAKAIDITTLKVIPL